MSWECPKCGTDIEERFVACRACGHHKSAGGDGGGHATETWECPACGNTVEAQFTACKTCGQQKPAEAIPAAQGKSGGRPGDWTCPNPECGDVVYSNNLACRMCGWPKGGQLPDNFRPGNWFCPGCGDHQFAKNQTCRKCSYPKPSALVKAQAVKHAQEMAGSGASVAQDAEGLTVNGVEGRPGDWVCPNEECGLIVFAKNLACKRCGTPKFGSLGEDAKGGDWACASCADHNYARNPACRRCGAPRPVALALPPTQQQSPSGHTSWGDWTCLQCGDVQFAKKEQCRKCGSDKPALVSIFKSAKPGDWVCVHCKDLQFSKNDSCRQCGSPKPQGGAERGLVATSHSAHGPAAAGGGAGAAGAGLASKTEWHCPSCGDLQFAKNVVCRKCGTPKPEHAANAGTFPSGGCSPTTGGGGSPRGGKSTNPGDWYCLGCNDLQFARNVACRKCGAPKPEGAGMAAGQMMGAQQAAGGQQAQGGGGPAGGKGPDWYCPNCGDLQFASRVACRKCGNPRPENLHLVAGLQTMGAQQTTAGGLRITPPPPPLPVQPPRVPRDDDRAPDLRNRSPAGGKGADWRCPNCGDLQFASRWECRICGTPKPEGAGMAASQQMMGAQQTTGGQLVQFVGSPTGGKLGDWHCPNCGDLAYASRTACRKCGTPKPEGAGMAAGQQMRGAQQFSGGQQPQFVSSPMGSPRGADWHCPNCGDLQFASRVACRKCGAPKPEGAGVAASQQVLFVGGPAGGKPGDWRCPGCGDLAYASRAECRKCGTPKPEGAGAAGGQQMQLQMQYGGCQQTHHAHSGAGQPMQFGAGKGAGKRGVPGEWTCPSCGDLQFARNDSCRKCGTARPEGVPPHASAGDWYCPGCNDMNFGRNVACRKCGTQKPALELENGAQASAVKEMDWTCPSCTARVWWKHSSCIRCGASKPADGAGARNRSRTPAGLGHRY